MLSITIVILCVPVSEFDAERSRPGLQSLQAWFSADGGSEIERVENVLGAYVYATSRKTFDTDAFKRAVCTAEWADADNVQVLIQEEDDDRFTMWSVSELRGGESGAGATLLTCDRCGIVEYNVLRARQLCRRPLTQPNGQVGRCAGEFVAGQTVSIPLSVGTSGRGTALLDTVRAILGRGGSTLTWNGDTRLYALRARANEAAYLAAEFLSVLIAKPVRGEIVPGAVEQQLEQTRRVLSEIQFGEGSDTHCRLCSQPRAQGHAEACPVRAALDAAPPKVKPYDLVASMRSDAVGNRAAANNHAEHNEWAEAEALRLEADELDRLADRIEQRRVHAAVKR